VVIDRFGSDALRFYCMREVSFGQDGSVSAAGFEARYESELANDWGNLASRTLAMIERYRDGVVPEGSPDMELGLAGLDGTVRGLLDDAELSRALEEIWSRVRRLNAYVEESKPWELAKDESQSEQLDNVLYNLAEGIRFLALLLHPYMPESSGHLLDALAEGNRELDAFGARRGGQTIERIPALFPKLD
jgi:methionyl-tRNA synthetase